LKEEPIRHFLGFLISLIDRSSYKNKAKMSKKFDVLIVGGGHAGIEAAYAASKMGSSVCLITPEISKIGNMPCNPSIGGLGKSHLVYEISALGGLMPQLCSKTYLQARMLNTSRGPAVQGLRLQIDKKEYALLAQESLKKIKNLTILEKKVRSLLIDGGKVSGVILEDSEEICSGAVVVTAGTFLNGIRHIGDKVLFHDHENGPTSPELSESIEAVTGAKLGRLKTGTPPRILKDSIDYSGLIKQDSDDLDYLFEFDHKAVEGTHSCYIAKTNEETNRIIQEEIGRSSIFSGNITGVGPRYCPSIEDKVNRFPDRASHHVFIEPEGVESDEIYPSGISTSLPEDVQIKYIQSMAGFKDAVITKAGYAVEYDFLQPNHLKHSLECKKVEGLFFAGQVNGTTGYEEAAAQGLIAGINANNLVSKKEPFVLMRTESYIGVMIDDLVTLGVDEPYRMFTSRAERRLILRQDNAFLRIMPHAYRLGLIDDDLYGRFLKEKDLIEGVIEKLDLRKKTEQILAIIDALEKKTFDNNCVEQARKLIREIVDPEFKTWSEISSRAILTIHAHVRYSGFIQIEKREVEKSGKYMAMEIPEEFSFKHIPGISIELQQKLTKIAPKNIGAAKLIPGMTPAAISILIYRVRDLKVTS
jgi:tRNA uridine 5-carboxymethylaminomethyl modification enzyme